MTVRPSVVLAFGLGSLLVPAIDVAFRLAHQGSAFYSSAIRRKP